MITIQKVYVNDYLRGYKPLSFSILPANWIAVGDYYKYTKLHGLETKDFLVDIHIAEGSQNEQALAGIVRTTAEVTIYWNNNTDTLRVNLLRPEEVSG